MSTKFLKLETTAIFFAGVLLTSCPVMGSTDWSIMKLGEIGNAANVVAVNDVGQVTGYSLFDTNGYTSIQTFITDPMGVGFKVLGTFGGRESFPADINNAGQVTGSFLLTNGEYHAYLTGLQGEGITDLGTYGAWESEASAINNLGQVVGSIWESYGNYEFMTGPNGIGEIPIRLPVNIDYIEGKTAIGINDSGQVVGTIGGRIFDNGDMSSWESVSYSYLTGPQGDGKEAIIWDSNIDVTGINNHGQVIGVSYTPDAGWNSFVTGPNGEGMVDLGNHSPFYNPPIGISDSGLVVWGDAFINDHEHRSN